MTVNLDSVPCRLSQWPLRAIRIYSPASGMQIGVSEESVPCRPAHGLPFSQDGLAYQAAREAARPYRTLHPHPSD
jgi:hypothetical protein